MFLEKEYKDYSKRVELTLRRSEDSLLSPWQISTLVSKLSSHYYKSELLNTISLALSSGIKPQNIFIMDESFQVNNSYSYVNSFDLTSSEGIKNLYHLGFPISLFPNEEILKVRLSFLYFNKIFTFLNLRGFDRPNKDELLGIIQLATSDIDFEFALDKIKKLAYEIINEPSFDQFNSEPLLKKVNELYQDVYHQYIQFKKDEVLWSQLEKDISKGNLGSITNDYENKEFLRVNKEYFNKFFRVLSDLARPIVGIYHPEKDIIQIICHSFINKEERDAKFVDIKKISHNSPYLICLLIGIGVVPPLIKTFRSIQDNRTLEENERMLRDEDESTQADLETMYELLEEMNSETENKAIDDIENPYLQERLKAVRQKNNDKFNEPIVNYSFNNTGIQIKIIHNESSLNG